MNFFVLELSVTRSNNQSLLDNVASACRDTAIAGKRAVEDTRDPLPSLLSTAHDRSVCKPVVQADKVEEEIHVPAHEHHKPKLLGLERDPWIGGMDSGRGTRKS